MILSQTYNREVSTELTLIWTQALSELSCQELTAACAKHIKIGKFFPTPAHILELAGHTELPQSSIADIQAEDAWLKILHYVEHWHPDIGPMRGCPGLTEREARALQSIGGPLVVQESSTKAVAFMRKDFISHFKNLEHFGKFMLDEPTQPKQLNAAESIGEIIKRRTQ